MSHRVSKWWLLVFSCLFFGLGFKFHSNNLYLLDLIRSWLYTEIHLPDEYKNKILVKYSCGIPLFIDRIYYDSACDKRLDGLVLLQIPRHLQEKTINLHTNNNIIVYRMMLRDDMLHGYDKTDIKVNVQSINKVHVDVISKHFPKGFINLKVGGKFSSSPILIKKYNHSTKIKILNEHNTSQVLENRIFVAK